MRRAARLLAIALFLGAAATVIGGAGMTLMAESSRQRAAAFLEPYAPFISRWLYGLDLKHGVPLPPERPHFLEMALPQRLAQNGFALGQPVFIRIIKQDAQMELFLRRPTGWRLFQVYPICAWSGVLGPKLKEGDGQSPEGFYEVTAKALNPNSSYHLSFNLGFPNAYDRAHGRTGSFLMVHGACASIGCYAMTDEGIDEIYKLVEAALDKGQTSVPVHVFPFRMTAAAIAKEAANRNAAFWRELQEGWDHFRRENAPPRVFACPGPRYAFRASEGPEAVEGLPGCKPIKGL